MIRHLKSYSLVFLACLSVLVFATGCEEDITSVTLSDNAFTMYGIINPLEDIQAVRVYEIDELLAPIKPDPLDATVQSTDLTSGSQVLWQDSVVSFENGKFGHVFWAPITPEHGHTYRLEVSRPGGATARAETTVPPISDAELQPFIVSGFNVLQPVLWKNAPNLIDIRVRYFTNVGLFEYDYNVSQDDVADGKQVMITVRDDSRIIFQRAIVDGVVDVQLNHMDMRVVVTDKDWIPPGGEFDAHVFSQPGTFSNVETGFGFVGAGYPTSIDWVPSNEFRRELGFIEQ
jgi:hypothetical protein